MAQLCQGKASKCLNRQTLLNRCQWLMWFAISNVKSNLLVCICTHANLQHRGTSCLWPNTELVCQKVLVVWKVNNDMQDSQNLRLTLVKKVHLFNTKYSSNILTHLLTYQSRLTNIKIVIKLYLECNLCTMHMCFNVTIMEDCMKIVQFFL